MQSAIPRQGMILAGIHPINFNPHRSRRCPHRARKLSMLWIFLRLRVAFYRSLHSSSEPRKVVGNELFQKLKKSAWQRCHAPVAYDKKNATLGFFS